METETVEKNPIKAAPELRFMEFEEVWQKVELGKFLNFKNGLNSDKGKYGSGVKFINVLDIINNDFITYNKIIGSVEVTEKEIEKNSVEYGDILFQRSSETREEVGQANVYLDKEKIAVFGGFVIRGKKVKDYNPKFLNYLLKTAAARKEITSKSGGSTRYNVGQETLKEVVITTTSLPEQQKIASFLSSIDRRIEQLNRKKSLLETYKKGVMQKLFSQKIRFTDEDGTDFPEWKKKTLGDLGEIITGSTPPTADPSYYNGSRLFVSPSDISSGRNVEETNTRISERGIKKGRLITKGSVLFVCIGSTIGKVAQAGEDCITNQQINAIVPNSNFLSDFIYSLLNFYGDRIKLLAGVQAVPQINKTNFSKLKFAIPVLEEQQKIADFLSVIDKKIEAVSQQIEKTQTFKKGLLQQMFV